MEDEIILFIAKNLMIADGIIPSGYMINEEYPENYIRNILLYQTIDVRNKARRKYRKIKKFVKKKYKLETDDNLIIADHVKMYYIEKARKLLNE